MTTATVKRRVRVVVDSDPMDPREWDCASRMICWHSRYNLGDDHDYACDNFMRELASEADDSLEDELYRLENEVWDRLTNYIGCTDRAHELVDNKIKALVEKTVRDGYLILPLYLMDHSGISMSTGSFGCPWDSGQVGYIICDNETIQREWGGDREAAEKYLRADVAIYDAYISGNVYGFIVEERDESDCPHCGHTPDWVEVDSCWGFFGDDPRTNGMADHLGDEELVCMACDAVVE